MQLIDVTSDRYELLEPTWLARAERVHRQLRPQIPEDYAATMRGIFADGAGMAIAADGDDVLGVAVHRAYRNTFAGRRFYVDDLVTDDTRRSTGVGRALLAHCEALARRLGCVSFELDSGVQRARAHKFYFREGMTVSSFAFKKSL
jgi:GNAT superfamily N-acetyltransferase